MKLFIIFIITSFQSIGLAQDIYLFDQGGEIDYTIKLSDIEPGHSARQIKNGFLLGIAKSKRREFDMDKPVEELFKETIEANKKESDSLKKSEKQLIDKFNSLDDEFGKVAESEKHDLSDQEFLIQWNQFESCAKSQLPRLKQAIYLKKKSKSDPKAKERYDLIKSLYLSDFSNGGLVCGALLGPRLKWSIDDEITNVKVLTTILAAETVLDKKHLFETLLAGYEQSAPEESRILFVYFWAKISFMTITKQGPLPSHFKMVQEFQTKPEKIQSEMILDGEVVSVETEISYADLKKQMSIGRQFIIGLGLKYE